MGEKKGFFSRLVSGLTKQERTLLQVLIQFFMDSQKLMMISMRN